MIIDVDILADARLKYNEIGKNEKCQSVWSKIVSNWEMIKVQVISIVIGAGSVIKDLDMGSQSTH